MTSTQTAFAPVVHIERMAGAFHVYTSSGVKLGQVDLIRGFAHYYGVRGGAHEGVTAVVRDGLEGLKRALVEGLRSGRNDER